MNLKLLKTFSAINNGVVLKEGKPITTMSAGKSVLAVHHTPSPYDFAIYDLGQFLSMMSLTSESRDVEIDGRVMNIKDGKTKMKFYGSAESTIVTPPDDLSPLTDADYTNEITVTQDEFKQLMNAAAVMNAKYLRFVCDGSEVTIKTESDYDEANSYEASFQTENGSVVEAKLDRSTVKVPTDSSYTISIGQKAVRFISEDTDYYIVRAPE